MATQDFPARAGQPAVVALRRSALALAVSVGLIGGCSHHNEPRPLTPQAFYPPAGQPQPSVTNPPSITEDQSGEVTRVQPTAGVKIPTRRPPKPAAPAPTTAPSGAGAMGTSPNGGAVKPIVMGATSGQYQVLGTVVAVVNNSPIYATSVLTPLNKVFSQRARELDQPQFREFATQKIHERLQELVDDEVLFAAAQRGLSEDDQKLAEQITLKWRMDQITQAGGSLEVARSKATADGDDFDELCRQQYRRHMIEVYRFKKIVPRIQVNAEDLRRYYDKHKDDEFTQHASARFRLLEVNVAKSGDNAVDKIAKKLERAKAGEDFKAMCAAENDDPMLSSVSGDLGWKDKGSLPPTLEKIEQAVWDLKPGQFTDVIQVGRAFYVAQLVEVRRGLVRPFNEQPSGEKPSVQEEIDAKLRKEQFRALSGEINDKLIKDAVWSTDPEKLQLCLDMAMQRYAQWRAAGQTSNAQ